MENAETNVNGPSAHPSPLTPHPSPRGQRGTGDGCATARWLRYLAIAAACATFPLVVAGGLVTTTRVGMADPQWPTPPWYLLGQFGESIDRGIGFVIEHSHRLLGWLVGFLTLALAAGLWFGQRRAWLRWMGCVALAAVSVQGLLGGLRIILHNQTMALVHGVFAQLFFAFMVCLAAMTGAAWVSQPASVMTTQASRLQRLSLITAALIGLQLVFGATLRHLGFTWALVAHLFTALAISVHVALLAKRVFTDAAVQTRFARPVEVLVVLVLGQLMLGAGAWATSTAFGLNVTATQSGTQMFFATAHVSAGALILATSALFTMQCYWFLAPATIEPDRGHARTQVPRPEARPVRPSVSSLESRELWRSGVTA
jgi:cytochrome c oxidase assembly protein subunit 15